MKGDDKIILAAHRGDRKNYPVDSSDSFVFCRAHGIVPCVCIADTREDYEKALALGCRMFTSNDIAAADEVLRALGGRGN